MNQQKIGNFLKELRKEKGLTQEKLSEEMNVSNRTVSRWENGNNMPDLSVLAELADFYDVDVRELIDGERKSGNMDKEIKDTMLKAADYSNEKQKLIIKKLHFFSWIGVICFVVFLVLEFMGKADGGITEDIASFCLGVSFGMMIIAVIYTSLCIYKINSVKSKIFNRD